MNATTAGSARRAILVGGLAAGILDLAYAVVMYGFRRGVSPVRIFQSIASGLLGADAYEGGAGTAALGIGLHFLIAFVAAAVFVLASRRLPSLIQKPILWGTLHGMAVYLFMNFVVLPLSAFPGKISHPPAALAMGLAGHIVCVGLPISLAARRFLR
jgi:uncharacterized membrane protein YagU involved in acid resistance